MHMYEFFPLPFYQPLQLPMIRTPNLLSFPQHIHNLHLTYVAPHVGTNLLIEG
jgi:hypothetical protein